MKTNTLAIEISRPPETVFNFTINPANTHLWISSIATEETNEWPIKIGSVYRNKNVSGEWSTYRVAALIEKKLFELMADENSYHVAYTYTELPNNTTKLTYHEWVDDGELANPFTQKTLEKLKEVIEST